METDTDAEGLTGKSSVKSVPNELLKYARVSEGYKQQDVVDLLGYHDIKGSEEPWDVQEVKRWEAGKHDPSLTALKRLEDIFKKSAAALGYPDEGKISFGDDIREARSQFFTGREDILQTLYDRLLKQNDQEPPLPPALVGISGVGKTQIAVEYAYRSILLRRYHTIALLHADSRETLALKFAQIASLVGLAVVGLSQEDKIKAVKRWLSYAHPKVGPVITRWLLIFDGAEDLGIVREFIPQPCRGHIIITTQSAATGEFAWPIEVPSLMPELGAYYLLRGVKAIEPSVPLSEVPKADYTAAERISVMVDGLPRALVTACAYMDGTSCSLSEYPEHYLEHPEEHLGPIAITWAMNLAKLRESNPVAYELLCLFVFLVPHGIPEEIVLEGTAVLGPLLQPLIGNKVAFSIARSDLLRFSFVRRAVAERTCSLHSSLQEFVRMKLSEEDRRQWGMRAVLAMDYMVSSEEVEFEKSAPRYFPHMQACVKLIRELGIVSEEAAALFEKTAYYFYVCGQYVQAEQLFREALAIFEKVLGPTHSRVASSLSNVGEMCSLQGGYAEAEQLFLRAKVLREETLGGDYDKLGTVYNNLGGLYQIQGRYTEAEAAFIQAITLYESVEKTEGLKFAHVLSNLGLVYERTDKLAQAKALYERAIAIGERLEEIRGYDIAAWYSNLAMIYLDKGEYDQAEVFLHSALTAGEDWLGKEHPFIAGYLNNLGDAYFGQGKYEEAKSLYDRALAIRQKMLGQKHYLVAQSINKVGRIYRESGEYDKAEVLLKRAVDVGVQTAGEKHEHVGTWIADLGKLYHKQGKYRKAERHYKQAVAIWERALGVDHSRTKGGRESLAQLQKDRAAYIEAPQAGEKQSGGQV